MSYFVDANGKYYERGFAYPDDVLTPEEHEIFEQVGEEVMKNEPVEENDNDGCE